MFTFKTSSQKFSLFRNLRVVEATICTALLFLALFTAHRVIRYQVKGTSPTNVWEVPVRFVTTPHPSSCVSLRQYCRVNVCSNPPLNPGSQATKRVEGVVLFWSTTNQDGGSGMTVCKHRKGDFKWLKWESMVLKIVFYFKKYSRVKFCCNPTSNPGCSVKLY